MCSRYRLDDTPEVRAMLDILGISATPTFQQDIAPTMPISIIRQSEHGIRELVTATWWLCLDRETGQAISQYPSFNSRSDRLCMARSIAFRSFRTSRCIIPASAFIERLADESVWHKIELQDSAIAFGGIFQDYSNKETGEVFTGASIITLPPVRGWEHIHPTSMPLMLDYTNRTLVESWLDRGDSDVEQFERLLRPEIRHTQRVTRIGKASQWNPVGETFTIAPTASRHAAR